MPELLGDSLEQRARIAMLVPILDAFKLQTVMPQYVNDSEEDGLSRMNKEIDTRLPPILASMGDKKFLVADTPRFIDFFFFESYQNLLFSTNGKMFADYPKLKEFDDAFRALPGMTEYLATTPDNDKLFNNANAKITGKARYDTKY